MRAYAVCVCWKETAVQSYLNKSEEEINSNDVCTSDTSLVSLYLCVPCFAIYNIMHNVLHKCMSTITLFIKYSRVSLVCVCVSHTNGNNIYSSVHSATSIRTKFSFIYMQFIQLTIQMVFFSVIMKFFFSQCMFV